MKAPIQSIVIAGGGSAGWMCAAALSAYVPETIKITLIESEEIGIIGVGEASIPPLAGFNRLLGIDETAFIKATKASYKLGIEFVDWGGLNERYLHPFSRHGIDLGLAAFHHYWLRAKQLGFAKDISTYSIGNVFASSNRFSKPATPNSPLSELTFAYHFDAGLYANFLRDFAVARGVQRIEGKIANVELTPDTGFISALNMASGVSIKGDLFVDCTGFRALLCEKALGVGFVDWSSLLPCDRAVAVPCENLAPLTPYTRATARESGWTWRIPLQHRTGNGYVYSSNHLSDDEAADTLLKALDGKPLAEPRVVKFKTGRREKAWTKNCISIGLACGFLEPLESTAIHLIQKGVLKLLQCLPDSGFDRALIEEYNHQVAFEYEDVRDFLVLHYKASARDDTPFWRDNAQRAISDSLQQRIDLFRDSGRLFIKERELFKLDSWLSVMIGQNITPQSFDPMAHRLPEADLRRALDYVENTFVAESQKAPLHQDYLRSLVG